MIPSKDIQLQTAIWALKRIVSKQGGLRHSNNPANITAWPCDCPRCIAKRALEQIADEIYNDLQEHLEKR